MVPTKRKKFREAVEFAESDKKCRYDDVPGIATFFERLALINLIAGVVLFVLSIISGFSEFGAYTKASQSKYGNPSFPAAAFGTPLAVAVATLVVRSVCLLLARGAWILVDIEKSNRVTAEASFHLVKLLERQLEPQKEEVGS